jgi:dihydroneopterin aldolase
VAVAQHDGANDQARRLMADPGLRRIFLRDMILAASVGVHAFEHHASQRIRINVDLDVADEGAHSPATYVGIDDLSRVVDYEAVANRIRAIVAAGHVRLLETMAERLAETCLIDPRVQRATIRIEKLDIFNDMTSVGVEIERFARGAQRIFPRDA